MSEDPVEDIDEDVQQTITELNSSLDGIETNLAPFLGRPLKDMVEELPPLEAAKLYVVGACAINTLFYIYLKTQGVDPATHPVKEEMERVKAYFKKVQAVSVEQTKQESNINLNVQAANRFIAAALGGEEADALKQENKKLAEATAKDAEGTPGDKKQKKRKIVEDGASETPSAEKKATKKSKPATEGDTQGPSKVTTETKTKKKTASTENASTPSKQKKKKEEAKSTGKKKSKPKQ